MKLQDINAINNMRLKGYSIATISHVLGIPYTAIDAECEKLLREMDVVAGLIRSCIEENATQAVDQSDYHGRYTSYVERYETLKDRYTQLQVQREER